MSWVLGQLAALQELLHLVLALWQTPLRGSSEQKHQVLGNGKKSPE